MRQVNLNQELATPTENELSAEWRRTIDFVLDFLSKSENGILRLLQEINYSLTASLANAGIDLERLAGIVGRSENTVKSSFLVMREEALSVKRDLNLLLLQIIKDWMKGSYEAAKNVPQGDGLLQRINEVMYYETEKVVDPMFGQVYTKIRGRVETLVSASVDTMVDLIQDIVGSIRSVHSGCRVDQSD